jgi:hypothetical protein
MVESFILFDLIIVVEEMVLNQSKLTKGGNGGDGGK